MTWFDISLSGRLESVLVNEDVVNTDLGTKQEREFKSKLIQELISEIAGKYIPYTVQGHLKEVAKQAYNVDHLFSVDYDTDNCTITIMHHWQSAKKQDHAFAYVEQSTTCDLEVSSIERFLNSMIARQYNHEYNQIIDNWLKRKIQLPHGETYSTVASPYLVIYLKPKNPEK